ncbi:MAG: glycosyltransferase [Rikenellaceae bacterium]
MKFSILIPTWNNLPMLKLCIESIEKNSRYKHQILLYINDGKDGTLEWVKKSGYEYIHAVENRGVCYALNSLRSLVRTQYICFANDDMYLLPDWDYYLCEEIESLPDNKFFLSSTLLQPRKFYCKSVISPANYGRTVESFKEEALLKEYSSYKHSDWYGATWPVNVVHRDMWDEVGGYSIEYSPGMYSDPDFSAKLYLAGVRYFKGLDKSRVYHFEAVSTGRVKKNKGSRQFLMKWGITSRTFVDCILKRGEPIVGEYNALPNHKKLGGMRTKSKIKRALLGFKASGAVFKIWQ